MLCISAEFDETWEVQLIYNTKADYQVSFPDLLSTSSYTGIPVVAAKYNNQTFANASYQNNLKSASRVMMVIYDNKNTIRQKLVFRGSSAHYLGWFSASNLESSSFWDQSELTEAKVFRMKSSSDLGHDSPVEITVRNNVTCQEYGFLKMICKNNYALCPYHNQLLLNEHEILARTSRCILLYSKSKSGVDYWKGAAASKLQILTQK